MGERLHILSLCDYTGNMLKPWADSGAYCMAVDIAHDVFPDDGIVRVPEDIRIWGFPTEFDWVFAFPPCTHLASSGARWWEDKGLSVLIESLELVNTCLEICKTAKVGWMIENPVGRLSTCWRKPDYTFDPCDYGDPYTKKTCLWTGGMFRMPDKTPVEPVLGSKMHYLPPSKNRARLRSETPMGFANAVYNANKNQHKILEI